MDPSLKNILEWAKKFKLIKTRWVLKIGMQVG